MVHLLDEGGPLSPVIVLAREYGKVLISAAGGEHSSPQSSLQAECLSGVYVHERGGEYVGDVSKELYSAYEATTTDGVDPDFILQRKAAFFTFARSDVGSAPLRKCMETTF